MKKIIIFTAVCLFAHSLAASAITEIDNPAKEPAGAEKKEQGSGKLTGKLTKKEIYSLDNKVGQRKYATAKVEVITSQDIENQNSPVLSVLMNQISGVTIQQSSSVGSNSSFRIRGTDRVRVLIDGIRSDNPNDNKFYLQDYISDDIERIEVVKGPSGSMAGTQASGGLVGIFTKRGYGEPNFKLQSDFGNFGTFKERASLSGSTEKTDYYFSTTFLKTDGGAKLENSLGRLERMRNDDYKNFNMVGNFGHKILDGKGEIRNVSRFSNAKKSIGYVGTMQDYNNYTTNLNFTNTSIFDYKPTDWYDSSTRFGLYTNTNNFYQHDDLTTFGPDVNSGRSSYRGTRLNLVSQHNFNYKDFNKFSIGYNMEYEKYTADSWYGEADYGWGIIDPATKDKYWGSLTQNDIYANDTINIKDILFLKGGARFSHNSLYGNFVSPNGSAALVLPTFKIAGAYSKLRGSWGKTTNTPSFYQKFGEFSGMQIRNPDLGKEQFEGWDVGFEQAFFNEKLMFDVGYFNNKYKDYIAWNDGWPGMYINIQGAKINGYETGVSWQPNEKFRTSFNYTYTHSEDTKTGYQLPATPNNRVNITTYYTPSDRLTLYASVAGSVDRVYTYDFMTKEPKRVGGYADVSLGGKVKLREGKKTKVYLTAQIFNLLNQKISMYKGIYHPGISCLIGLNVEFKTKGQWL